MDVCGWDGWMDVTLRLRPIHPLSFASHLRAALLDLGLVSMPRAVVEVSMLLA